MSETFDNDAMNKVIGLLAMSAYQLWIAMLHGGDVPSHDVMRARMKAPEVGDIVMETSTIGHRIRDHVRIGRLLRVTREPVFTPEKWAEGGGTPDEPIPDERVVYIKPLVADVPGGEYRWTNADFIVVAEDPWKFPRDPGQTKGEPR
jgi:hypothetical protein